MSGLKGDKLKDRLLKFIIILSLSMLTTGFLGVVILTLDTNAAIANVKNLNVNEEKQKRLTSEQRSAVDMVERYEKINEINAAVSSLGIASLIAVLILKIEKNKTSNKKLMIANASAFFVLLRLLSFKLNYNLITTSNGGLILLWLMLLVVVIVLYYDLEIIIKGFWTWFKKLKTNEQLSIIIPISTAILGFILKK